MTKPVNIEVFVDINGLRTKMNAYSLQSFVDSLDCDHDHQELMNILVKHPSHGVRRSVARHKLSPEAFNYLMAREKVTDVITSLLYSNNAENFTTEQVFGLLENSAIAVEIASYLSSFDPDNVDIQKLTTKLASHPDPEVRKNVVHHLESKSTLNRLSQDGDSSVAQAAIERLGDL